MMKSVVHIILFLVLLASSTLAMGQSSLYKRFEKSKDVEVYYIENYKEFEGQKLNATLVRYEKGDHTCCRQVYSKLMNQTSGLACLRQTQNKKIVTAYWYNKGCVMIITYKMSEGKVNCMRLEGNITRQQAKKFLESLDVGKPPSKGATNPSGGD